MVVNQTDEFLGGGRTDSGVGESVQLPWQVSFKVSKKNITRSSQCKNLPVLQQKSHDDPYQSYQYLPYAYLEDVRIFPHLKNCKGEGDKSTRS